MYSTGTYLLLFQDVSSKTFVWLFLCFFLSFLFVLYTVIFTWLSSFELGTTKGVESETGPAEQNSRVKNCALSHQPGLRKL
jgi:hypothetical protein